MVAIVDTGDYIVRALEIQSYKSELLDEFGNTEISIRFKDNEDKITSCKYIGYKGNEILNKLAESGTINIDIEDWEVYRNFSIEVNYKSYNDIKEYYEVNKLIKKEKDVNKKSDKEQWDALERLDAE